MVDYDIVVLGSGIAGSTLALALAQAGIKTLVIEAFKHPRFVIGESTVPLTTSSFDYIGRKWNIPELVNLTRYISTQKQTPDCADYPKAAFWFGWHAVDKQLEISQELYIETFDPPIGPDTHIVREKFDQYLVSLFPKYKVDYLDQTLVTDFKRDEEMICHLTIKPRGGNQEKIITSRFIVDATGHSAFFSKKLNYFEEDRASLKNDTRSIYGHFKLNSTADLDELMGGPCLLYRFKRKAATMHHCFPGGWIWIIPFDDETVSVGIVLNRKSFPEQPGVSAKEEFFSIINRFPTIKAHLGKLEPTRPLVRKKRLQIMSKRILGDGVIITPHAAAFIDPLFSTGMLMTVSFVRDFVAIAHNAFKTHNYAMDQFKPLEEVFFRTIRQVDTIVAGTIESFRHIEVFKQYWRIWICAAFYQAVYNIFLREDKINLKLCGLYGSNIESFRQDVSKMWDILQEGKFKDQFAIAEDLKKIVDEHWIFCKGHPYEHHMVQIGSKFPLKVNFKKTFFSLILHLIKKERKNISLPKVLWRGVRLLVLFRLANILSKKLRISRIDKRRASNLKSQRLPWYDSNLLK